MGASTFGLVVFAVLAAELIEEFGVDRWQVGALVTAMTISGALISPSVGTLTDRIGARRATVVTLIASGGALAAMSVSPVFALVAFFALVGGVGQAIANPATNKLISMHVPAGRRGVITGIKQSGVQVGTFLGGLLSAVLARRVEVSVERGKAFGVWPRLALALGGGILVGYASALASGLTTRNSG